MDVAYDQEAQSSQVSQEIPPSKETQTLVQAHRPVCLGFEPPPEEHVPGIRARKSRGRKVAMRAIGAEG